jgi:hypothetical protein
MKRIRYQACHTDWNQRSVRACHRHNCQGLFNFTQERFVPILFCICTWIWRVRKLKEVWCIQP